MQTDIWLPEEVAHPERCPLCSKPFKNGSTTCFSCGFSTKPTSGTSVWINPSVYGNALSSRKQTHHTPQQKEARYTRTSSQRRRLRNPITPIPLRTIVQPDDATSGSIAHPGSKRKNITSKLISEAPTRPEHEARSMATRRLPYIDEVTTNPELRDEYPHNSPKALVLSASQVGVTPFECHDETTITVQSANAYDTTSWTAGGAFQSPKAWLISSHSRQKNPFGAITLNPIDHVRWWLLRPGRIEFSLWLLGTIILIGVTSQLLLVTAFSFEWITPGFNSASPVTIIGPLNGSQHQGTVAAKRKMNLIDVDARPVLPGQSIVVHGQGFTPQGHIRFLFDGTQQLYNQIGQSDSTQANAQGLFTTAIVLNSNLPWHPGTHFINAEDLATKRMAQLPIILAPNLIGKGVSSTPVPSNPPVVAPPVQTPIPIGSGGQPTPVGQTPVPVTPIPHPGTPTPKPTLGTTPTVGSTPTVMPTVGKTPGVTTTAGTTVDSGLGNALEHTGDSSLSTQLMSLNPWVWLMLGFYCLSMVLLGLAGVLHKRHQ